jgi:hypothetical protein
MLGDMEGHMIELGGFQCIMVGPRGDVRAMKNEAVDPIL